MNYTSQLKGFAYESWQRRTVPKGWMVSLWFLNNTSPFKTHTNIPQLAWNYDLGRKFTSIRTLVLLLVWVTIRLIMLDHSLCYELWVIETNWCWAVYHDSSHDSWSHLTTHEVSCIMIKTRFSYWFLSQSDIFFWERGVIMSPSFGAFILEWRLTRLKRIGKRCNPNYCVLKMNLWYCNWFLIET